jgi:uncharacterized protein (DUF433 family)
VIRKFVESDPSVLNGAPRFKGTHVPLQALLEYRGNHVPVYEFLIDHPTVNPEHAKRIARWLARTDPAAAVAQIEALRSHQGPAAASRK